MKSVASSEMFEKVSGNLDDIDDLLVTIRLKGLDNKRVKDHSNDNHFQGQFAISRD